jgi:uncharacterized protein (TIGR02391 family)
MARITPLPPEALRRLCEILGDTNEGLSGTEIKLLLAESGIADPTPKAPNQYTYVMTSKKDRLYAALGQRQECDHGANTILAFVERAISPVRYIHRPDIFEERRAQVNEVLAFCGMALNESGKLAPREQATTLSEARRRASRLRQQLQDRGVHPRILGACGSEIRDDNYFHTVLEAAKSLADEIRQRSGLTEDGVPLIDRAFEKGKAAYPVLAFNKLQTETDWSEQRGLANLLRGVFGAMRNPTAHEPKVTWVLHEQDALDMLSLMSFLHRKLEGCTRTTPAV